MNFLTALKKRRDAGPFPVIPDIKSFSPKEGDLLRGRAPVSLALQLEAAGACVLSVVTEEREFHGSMDILRQICRAVSVPVLRKDFIESEADLLETKKAGASAILLMYACLGKDRLEALYEKALEMGLVPFVETHTAQELQWAAELGAGLVGINNRNILDLERDDGDVRKSESLAGFRPQNAFLVVESGLQGPADVRRAAGFGADSALVGTAILQAPDPAAMYRAMTRPCGLKICGIMDREGIRICREQQVDVLGFVTEYPVPVPWNLTREKAADLVSFAKRNSEDEADAVIPGDADQDPGAIPQSLSSKYGGGGNTGSAAGRPDEPGSDTKPGSASERSVKTCIVTGGTPDQVIRLAREIRPDLVQLHYTETAAETARITEVLALEGISVIRSIPADAAQRRRMFGTEDLPEIAKMMETAGVSALLLDSRDAGNAAAGGGAILEQMDAGSIRQIRSFFSGEIILGGGLTAANIREAVRVLRPDMADVMTGAETSPGRKSAELVSALVRALEN